MNTAWLKISELFFTPDSPQHLSNFLKHWMSPEVPKKILSCVANFTASALVNLGLQYLCSVLSDWPLVVHLQQLLIR